MQRTSCPSLRFVRPDSVDPADWLTIGLIYPDRVGQVMDSAPAGNHEWFYLSGMTPDEVAIFNIYDNQGLPSIGHNALDLQNGPETRNHRKSIESRILVRYA